jgi:hypothetical protein
MANLILPAKFETESVRRGRAVLVEIMDRCLELADKGTPPSKVEISTALCDDLHAFFDFTYDYDGVLPKQLCGATLTYVPGASRKIHFVTQQAA